MKSRPKPSQAAFAERLEVEKRASTLQLLFKVARLVDEEAVRRAARERSLPELQRSHLSLLPHIALEGTRITVLAERLGISKQAVSQLVHDLERMGVLTRVADPADARARLVQLTARGREGLFEGLKLLAALELELTQHVGARAMQQLRAALLALHDSAACWHGQE